MSIETRFEFPGFAATANKDTPTHQVEVGVIKDGDDVFVLHMIRNKEFAFLNFAVAKIFNAGKQLWTFQQAQFDGVGLLAKAAGVTVIALVGKGKYGKVERIIPLQSLVTPKQSGIRELIRLKVAAADFLGREYILSIPEDTVDRKDKEVAELALRAAEEETREAAREAAAAEQLRQAAALEDTKKERERLRLERIRTMLARGKVTGFTADGQERFGFPVLATEWQSCSHGVNVILVDSIAEDDTIGNMLEWFKVVKEPGRNPKKGSLTAVTAVKPESSQTSETKVEPTGEAMIQKDDDLYPVTLYASMDDIHKARARGLNGGSYVAVDARTKNGKILVLALHKEIETVGAFVPHILTAQA